MSPRNIGVSTEPGLSELTRMFQGATSHASARHSPITAAFVEPYTAWSVWPTCPETEAMLTIEPSRWRFMTGSTCLHARKVPPRFTSATVR